MINKKISNKKLAENLKENYSIWKNYSLKNENYFVIFNKFSDVKLKNINGNALKLYIYLGINSNTYTGEVWHSLETISQYFGKSERTIRSWLKDLEDLNLIYRMQLNFNKESHTFLQPYFFNDKFSPEKYTYNIRLKDLVLRNNIPLILFEDRIVNISKKFFKNKIYIKVEMGHIIITCFQPLTNQIKYYPQFLNNNLKELLTIYTSANSLNDIKNYTFETFKVKK